MCILGDKVANATTIRLEQKIKAELDELKNTKKESYAEVIERLIMIAKEDLLLEKDEIRQIENSLKAIKSGKVLTLKEAEKKWGI